MFGCGRGVAPCFQALIIVIHGLDASHGEALVVRFWKDMLAKFRKYFKHDERVIAFIGGNCRICEIDGLQDIVGSYTSPQWRSTFVTDAFTSFCKDTGLRIANTFEESLLNGEMKTIV